MAISRYDGSPREEGRPEKGTWLESIRSGVTYIIDVTHRSIDWLMQPRIPPELEGVLTQQIVRDTLTSFYENLKRDKAHDLRKGREAFIHAADLQERGEALAGSMQKDTLGDGGRQLDSVLGILEMHHGIRIGDLTPKQQHALRVFFMEQTGQLPYLALAQDNAEKH